MLFPSLFPFLLTSGESNVASYDTIQAYGNTKLDEWSFYNADIPDATLSIYAQSSAPTWGLNTILLMSFENNLDAGNFPTNDKPVTDWRLLRRIFGTTQFTEIGQIPNNNVNVFVDAKAASGVIYEYAIQSVSNGTRGQAVITQPIGSQGEPLEAISVSFFGWILQSLDGLTSYSFIVENETDSIETVIARTEYSSVYSQFIKVERGNLKYHKGGIKTRPYDCINNSFVFGNHASKVALETFLMDGQTKIMKNGSGDVYVVDIYDVSVKFDDILVNADLTQPYTATFKWVEIADISEV